MAQLPRPSPDALGQNLCGRLGIVPVDSSGKRHWSFRGSAYHEPSLATLDHRVGGGGLVGIPRRVVLDPIVAIGFGKCGLVGCRLCTSVLCSADYGAPSGSPFDPLGASPRKENMEFAEFLDRYRERISLLGNILDCRGDRHRRGGRPRPRVTSPPIGSRQLDQLSGCALARDLSRSKATNPKADSVKDLPPFAIL